MEYLVNKLKADLPKHIREIENEIRRLEETPTKNVTRIIDLQKQLRVNYNMLEAVSPERGYIFKPL